MQVPLRTPLVRHPERKGGAGRGCSGTLGPASYSGAGGRKPRAERADGGALRARNVGGRLEGGLRGMC